MRKGQNTLLGVVEAVDTGRGEELGLLILPFYHGCPGMALEQSTPLPHFFY